MTLPSTFLPLETRIYEVLCKGLGSSPRVIQLGRFRARGYPGQDADNQHKEALTASEVSPTHVAGVVHVFVEQWADSDGTQESGDRAQYDARIRVDVAYATDGTAQRNANAPTVNLISLAQTQAASDAHDIRAALCWPPNMQFTQGGLDTGIAGGGGIYQPSFGPVRFDPAAQLVTATLYFRAVVFLALP